MFRTMRRKAQELAAAENEAILKRHGEGVLAVCGDGGYPYAVPVNYVYDGGRIIIHGAKEGHKIESIRKNDKVSFCVIDEDKVVPEEYSTAYRSVIVFGRASVLEGQIPQMPPMETLLDTLASHFVPFPKEARMDYIRQGMPQTALIVITPEHITGKAGRLLMGKKG